MCRETLETNLGNSRGVVRKGRLKLCEDCPALTELTTFGSLEAITAAFFNKRRNLGDFVLIKSFQNRAYAEKKKNKNSSNDASYKKHQIEMEADWRIILASQSKIFTFLKQGALKKPNNNCLYNKS